MLADTVLDLPIAVPTARDVVVAILDAAPPYAVQPAATVTAPRRRMREQSAPRRIAREPLISRRLARTRRRLGSRARADSRRIRRDAAKLGREPHHVRRLAQRIERLGRIEDRVAARRAHQAPWHSLALAVVGGGGGVVDALEALDQTGATGGVPAGHRHRPRVGVEADGTGQGRLELVDQLLLGAGELGGQRSCGTATHRSLVLKLGSQTVDDLLGLLVGAIGLRRIDRAAFALGLAPTRPLSLVLLCLDWHRAL